MSYCAGTTRVLHWQFAGTELVLEWYWVGSALALHAPHSLGPSGGWSGAGPRFVGICRKWVEIVQESDNIAEHKPKSCQSPKVVDIEPELANNAETRTKSPNVWPDSPKNGKVRATSGQVSQTSAETAPE